MRPRKYKTVEELQSVIDAYFEKCDNRIKQVLGKDGEVRTINIPEPYTIQGLALALGFATRKSLMDYEGYDKDEDKAFLNTIKKAKLICEKNKVIGAMDGDYDKTIVIFDLKNNHNHNDRQEIEHKGITLNFDSQDKKVL